MGRRAGCSGSERRGRIGGVFCLGQAQAQQPARPTYSCAFLTPPPWAGECEGILCIKQAWPATIRGLFGDPDRFESTYFAPFPVGGH